MIQGGLSSKYAKGRLYQYIPSFISSHGIFDILVSMLPCFSGAAFCSSREGEPHHTRGVRGKRFTGFGRNDSPQLSQRG